MISKRSRLIVLSFCSCLLIAIAANFLSVRAAISSSSVPVELVEAPVAANCNEPSPNERHFKLIGNANTVHWGYFSKSLPPVLSIHSKDYQ